MTAPDLIDNESLPHSSIKSDRTVDVAGSWRLGTGWLSSVERIRWLRIGTA